MVEYKLKIDCQGEKVLSSDMVFVSGDVKAYRLTFDFLDGGIPVNTQNCVLVIRARRADGTCVEGAGEIIDGKGVYIPENNIYAVPGEVRLEIALGDSARSYITTKIITAEVVEGIGSSCQPEGTEVSIFVSLIGQLQSKLEMLNRLASEIVPIRGTDYWTDDDKAEIKSYVDEAILGGVW